MKTFCSHCGSGISYESVRPNFCPSCGFQIGGVKPARASAPAHEIIHRQPRYEEPEEESYATELDFDSLEVSLEGVHQPIPIKEVFGQGSSGENFGRRKAISKSDFKKHKELMDINNVRKLDFDGGTQD